MKLGLINSAWIGTSVGTEEGIRKTRQIGFDTIDIFADPLETDVRDRRLIRRTCQEERLPVISVACVALGLSDFNRAAHKFHVERAKAHLDLAYDLEARNLLLVIGEYTWQREVIKPADQWQIAVQNVRALGDHAASLGLEVAIELEPFRESLVNTLAEMVRFLNDVAHPAVKANMDISHLALSKTPAEAIEALRGRIAHVHFSDCDGKVHGDLPPGRGVVDFPPYLRALKQVGFDGAVSLELEYSPDPTRIVEWVEEAYQATSQLMQAAGVR